MKRRAMTLGLFVLLSCRPPVSTPDETSVYAPVAEPPKASPPRTPAGAPAPGSVPGESRRAPTVLRVGVRDVGDTTIRVLISSNTQGARVGSPGGVIFTGRDGSMLARAGRDETWTVEREGRRVRVVRPDGVPTVWAEAPMFARAMDAALLNLGGKPYRGDAALYAGDTSVLVVNVVKIDDYLRGVVPLEIGTKSVADSAAVQAQAITARSYAYVHLAGDARRNYDVTGSVQDQVYGGVAVETPVSSEAVESTRTLVLKYNGRVVNAPYSSTCGGSTAAASEVWRANDEPYLQAVSDQIPGSGRFYCDGAPRFRWTRTIDGATVNAALAQYLAAYVSVPGKKPGVANAIAVASHTPSGRVGTLSVRTERGNFMLRGNDIRYVLRPPGGEILNSTYFSVETTPAADGSIGRLTIRGMGYGHGVGMCQSGAIGRARAGQDFRTILHTYYTGTTIGPAE